MRYYTWSTPTLLGDYSVRSPDFASLVAEDYRILIIASERTKASVAFLTELLEGKAVGWFSAFGPNPRLDSACQAALAAQELSSSLIIGIGGGSAIDVAKAARVLPSKPHQALDTLREGGLDDLRKQTPLPRVVAVSTLAGSGAEVTQFATLYHEGRKYSVDAECVLPDTAVIDPTLATSAPNGPTTAAALDAICHAIESAWSRAATAESRAHSRRALECLGNMRWARDGQYSIRDRRMVALGALHAGTAINETRTTAAHAAAYSLTTQFDIPHGVACALNMQWVARLNLTSAEQAICVKATVEQGLGVSLRDLPSYFAHKLVSAGWPSRLRAYGVDRSHLATLADEATRETRMRNNPVPVSRNEVEDFLATLY